MKYFLLCAAGVPVHPDAVMSEGEPKGLDVSVLPPRAEEAQPVSGHLPADCRGRRLSAQQGPHAQGPQGKHMQHTHMHTYFHFI